jgi:pimeloyl-ACP methyl ester carboxylesterase
MKVIFQTIIRLICNRYVCVAIILFATLFAGSLIRDKIYAPDLHRLYMESMMVNDQPPVVFIHGVLGSKLKDEEREGDLWLGPLNRILLSDYSELAYDIDPHTLEPQKSSIHAYTIADNAVGKDFYGKIVRTLGDAGGYVRTETGKKVNPKQKNFYVFYYDWRQDNVITAGQLADFIDQIRLDYGQPDLKVDIVAHSMGGLITRYYIRYGRQDVVNDNDFDKKVTMYGGERVRRVILLGTPNLGSAKTLNRFINGVEMGLKSIGTETLATMPSLYQLFPHPLTDWLVTNEGKPLQRDLYDVEVWRRFQWSIFDPLVRKRILARFDKDERGQAHLQTLEAFFDKHLERARRFVWSLTINLPEPHPKLIVFGGGCTLTPARFIVEEIEGESVIRLYPEDVVRKVAGVDYDMLMLEPGDGSVTKASLLGRNVLDPSVKRHKYSFFPLDYSMILCEKHNSLTGNINFQDNLLNALLSRD